MATSCCITKLLHHAHKLHLCVFILSFFSSLNLSLWLTRDFLASAGNKAASSAWCMRAVPGVHEGKKVVTAKCV